VDCAHSLPLTGATGGTATSRLLHGFLTAASAAGSRSMPPRKPTRSPWLTAVAGAVRAIPRGQTASYARVALMAGKPGAARAVVRALHALEDVPWWRVVRSDGTLAEPVAREQARRLRAEGVRVDGRRLRPGR
jgi:methylated-DNA-protein-cysteine methyltransferase-like protein